MTWGNCQPNKWGFQLKKQRTWDKEELKPIEADQTNLLKSWQNWKIQIWNVQEKQRQRLKKKKKKNWVVVCSETCSWNDNSPYLLLIHKAHQRHKLSVPAHL